MYLISFILFIFYFKERLDNDSKDLLKSSYQSDINFNNSYAVLERQFKNGINIGKFYSEIQKLSDDNQKIKVASETQSQKKYPDYYLEFFMSLLLMSYWLLLFSTQNWCSTYLYIGLLFIFYLSNNQNKYFYRLVNYYSKLMSKIFPV